MIASDALFADRRDAGRRLARAVAELDLDDPVVLALPRGGVPVAYEVARSLRAPLDLLLVRKLGAPGHSEYGIGALVDGADPQVVLNEQAMEIIDPSPAYVDAEVQRQLVELERRREAYLGSRKPNSVEGRTIVLVDDGIATGSTVTVGGARPAEGRCPEDHRRRAGWAGGCDPDAAQGSQRGDLPGNS